MAKTINKIKITPRARKKAEELSINPEEVTIAGSGYDGGLCEKDILDYSAMTPKVKPLRVSPLARHIAEVEALSLEGIVGTGVNQKITKKDVLEVMALKAESIPETIIAEEALVKTADGKEILEEIPYAGVRKVIGQRLSQSAQTAPHVNFVQKVNMKKLLALREEVNKSQEVKTSVTDYIARAAVLALEKYPDINVSLAEEKIIKYKTINVGIAVAVDSGLIVPNVKNAEKLSIVNLSKEAKALVDKARENKLRPDEYSGGTFTISNLGMFGVDSFTSIINPPESAILGVSATKDEPIIVKDENENKIVDIAPIMGIQLAVDHRVIDGMLGALFIGEIKKLLENPIALLV